MTLTLPVNTKMLTTLLNLFSGSKAGMITTFNMKAPDAAKERNLLTTKLHSESKPDAKLVQSIINLLSKVITSLLECIKARNIRHQQKEATMIAVAA